MIDNLRDIGFLGLLFWSSFCILSPRVNDGVVGKCILMVVALGSEAALLGSDCAAFWVYGAVVAVFARSYFMAEFWPHLVAKFHSKA